MLESGIAGIELFNQAKEFWLQDSHEGLSELAILNIELVLEYASTSEGQASVKLRAKQLDDAIEHFNELNQSRTFSGPNEKESKKLAEEVLGVGEKFPLLRESKLDAKSLLPFLSGFRRLVGDYRNSKTHYYTFLDKKEAVNSKDLDEMITGLLVDGFAGFAFRARKTAEGRPSKIGKSDLVAVNTFCEMAFKGELQTDMYNSGWYKPNYGLDPLFCKSITSQFTK